MAVLDRAALIAKIDLIITTNGAKGITGALHNDLLHDIVDSLINIVTDDGKIGLDEYDVALTYNTGTAVVFQDGIYQAEQDGITGAFDPLKWTKIIGVNGFAAFDFVAYDNGDTYNIGDRVFSLGSYFICDINLTTGIVPADASPNWSIVFANNGDHANQWQAGFYLQGDIIQDSNLLYKLVTVTLPSFESSDLAAEIIAGDWVLWNNHNSPSDAEIKIAYENNANTNEFNDAEKTKLGNQSGTNTGDETSASDVNEGVIFLSDTPDMNEGTEGTKAITPALLKTHAPLRWFFDVMTGALVTTGVLTPIPSATFSVVDEGDYIAIFSATVALGDTSRVDTALYLDTVLINGSFRSNDIIRTGAGTITSQETVHCQCIKFAATAGQVIDVRSILFGGVGAGTVNAGGLFLVKKVG